jgi:integrase/recombinase XerD
MNLLIKAVKDYIALRRSLGYKLRAVPPVLSAFVSFLKERGADHITISLALEWSQQNPNVQRSNWVWRLTCIRGFARYRSASDPRTEIPSRSLLPYRPKRARPYLYTNDEVRCLLDRARKLGGLRGQTYYCLFGLLTVAGLRVSEALNLKPGDVDLEQGVLSIVGTKFGKSRLVPIHVSTQKALARYSRMRDRAFARSLPRFFVSGRGNRMDGGEMRRTFYKLSRQIGLRGPNDSHGPRLHDFRHRFAIETLVRWYRSGRDIEPRLPVLSTYLGHVNVSDTYWYLTACPELMGSAVKRLEKFWEVPS